MLKQRTLKSVVNTVGIGLHSGQKVRLTLHPAEINTGLVYRRIDMTPPVVMPAEATRVNDTRMATTLNEGEVKISTIEHLMSALSGLGIDNCVIDVDASEIPIMDGSGASFLFLIQAAGIVEQDAPKRFVRVLRPIKVTEGDKWAMLEPHEGYKLAFSINFGHPAIDETIQLTEVDFAKTTYAEAVSRARTFGFVQDVEMLRSIGLAQGGTLENAVVLDEYKILNPEGLRADDEFVKHKILDAMGDLYVLGNPLLARYSAFKSGHGLNNQLLRALLADSSAWEWATYEEAALAPVDFSFERANAF